MSAQITRFGKPLLTDCAFEGFLASMTPHMNFESARSHETLLAVLGRALEWSLTCMASEVV